MNWWKNKQGLLIRGVQMFGKIGIWYQNKLESQKKILQRYDLEVTRKILEDFHETSYNAVKSILETSLSQLYDARRQFSNNLGSLQINENRYVRTVIDFIGYKLRLVEEFS